MDRLIGFLTAPAPLWVALLLIALAGAAGWWWGRSFVPAEQPATVRAEKFATGRVAVQQPATEALTRVLAELGEVAGSDLPPRGALDTTVVAADFPPPGLALDGAHDVYPTDDLDEPEEATDDREPPAGGGEPLVPVRYAAALLPGYRVGTVQPVPAGHSVGPRAALADPRWLAWRTIRYKLRRLVTAGLSAVGRGWCAWLEFAREREADRRQRRADRHDLGGWAPGEATQVVTGEQPAVVSEPGPEPPPPSRPPQHQPGWGKTWAVVLVDGFSRTGTAGRHHAGVAVGALAQRQGRLLALPVGAP